MSEFKQRGINSTKFLDAAECSVQGKYLAFPDSRLWITDYHKFDTVSHSVLLEPGSLWLRQACSSLSEKLPGWLGPGTGGTKYSLYQTGYLDLLSRIQIAEHVLIVLSLT